MTQHDEMVYVARARDFGARALAMAAGRTHDDFVAEELRYVPVLYNLLRMSETAARTSASFRAEHSGVPWSEIDAVGEQVAPGFFADDPEATWRIATGPLCAYVTAFDAMVPPDLGQEQKDVETEARSTGEAAPRRGPRLSVPHDRLAELCRRYRVKRLRFFGSVLRDDFGPDSDVDVLVDFEPGVKIGTEVFRLEEELSELLGGHGVDLVESELLDKYVRNRVLRSAEDIYAA